jgi:hypothetical protein
VHGRVVHLQLSLEIVALTTDAEAVRRPPDEYLEVSGGERSHAPLSNAATLERTLGSPVIAITRVCGLRACTARSKSKPDTRDLQVQQDDLERLPFG